MGSTLSIEAAPSTGQNGAVVAVDRKAALPKRSMESKIQEAITNEEYMAFAEEVAKFTVDYRNNSGKYPVTPALPPGHLYSQIPKEAPLQPQSFDDLMKDFNEKVIPMMVHWHHPRFHAYFPIGRSYADTLADTIIASMSPIGPNWDTCPAVPELEHAMVNWMGKAIGLPEEMLFTESPVDSPGGGTSTESASDSIFTCLMASRSARINKELGKGPKEQYNLNENHDAVHDVSKKLVAYFSKDSHSCFEKACKMALVRSRAIQGKVENEWGITGQDLEEAVLKDIALGLIPFHIHITLGTTSTCASDKLDSIWPIAEKYGLWLHIDAAYAGSAWVCPEYRPNPESMRHVDSINCNASKWLLHSQPQCFFWTKRQLEFERAFSITPLYLKSVGRSSELRNWGIHLSRPMKSLKSWFVFRLYGIEGLQRHIRMHMEHTKYVKELVLKHPNFEMFSHHYALVTFFYKEPGMSQDEINDATQKLLLYINSTHKIFLTRTKVDNQNLIRFVVLYEISTREKIDESWKIMEDCIKEFQEHRKNGTLPENLGDPAATKSGAIQKA